MESTNDQPETITTQEYWEARKGHFLLRKSLPADHPENLYNWTKRTYPNIRPEDYGVERPEREVSRCPTCGCGCGGSAE